MRSNQGGGSPPRPSIRFFVLPEAMRPATCDVCGAPATVLVQENVPGGINHRICEPCYLDFTSTHDPLPDEPTTTTTKEHP